MYLWFLILLSFFLFPINNYSLKYVKKSHLALKNKYIEGRYLYFLILTILLVFITGYRADSVGRDTAMYHELYTLVSKSDSFFQAINLWQNKSIEIGYLGLEYLLSRCFDFHFASLIFAFVSITPVMFLIYKYSKNYFISFFVYITFGMYAFTLTGVRQSIAMGICCMAFICSKEKKLIRFLVLVFLASLVHKTAVIFLPVYWLINFNHSRRNIFLFITGLLLSFALRGSAYRVLNIFSRYQYDSTDSAGGIKLFLFILGTIVLSYFTSKKFFYGDCIDEKSIVYTKDFSIFNMVAFCALLWPITSANPVVFRLYYYYFIFMIIFIPNFIEESSTKSTRILLTMVYFIVGCYFLSFYILGNAQMMYSDFYFFWQ